MKIVPSKSVPKTPYEIWTGRKPILSHLHPWGFAAHVRLPTQFVDKLDARVVGSIFIRHSAHSKGYVFARECGGGEMIEIESHNVEFLEDIFSSISQSHSTIEL